MFYCDKLVGLEWEEECDIHNYPETSRLPNQYLMMIPGISTFQYKNEEEHVEIMVAQSSKTLDMSSVVSNNTYTRSSTL